MPLAGTKTARHAVLRAGRAGLRAAHRHRCDRRRRQRAGAAAIRRSRSRLARRDFPGNASHHGRDIYAQEPCRAAHHRTDGGQARRRAAGGARLAVRAEMGWLPLPRLPRRRRGRAAGRNRASRSRRYFPEMVAALRGARRRRASCSTASWPSRSATRCPSTRCRCACIRPRAASASSRPRRRRCSSCSTCCSTPTGKSLLDAPLTERRAALEAFYELARRSERARALARHPRPREARALARRRRRRARRRRRQAASTGLPPGRARDAEGQAPAHRRLRGRRLPLRAAGSREVGSLLLGLYDDEGMLDHVGFTSTIADERAAGADRSARSADRAARLHRQGAGRAEPLEHRAHRRMAAAASPSWWSRCATTMSPATASATAPSSCAGGRTRRRANARSSRLRRRCSPKTSSFCSSEVAVGSNSGPIELRCFAPWEGRV